MFIKVLFDWVLSLLYKSKFQFPTIGYKVLLFNVTVTAFPTISPTLFTKLKESNAKVITEIEFKALKDESKKKKR